MTTVIPGHEQHTGHKIMSTWLLFLVFIITIIWIIDDPIQIIN